MSELTFEDGWTAIGRIGINGGNLVLPEGIPDEPGLYCLLFSNGKRYYGEAGNLKRRLGDYVIYYAATGIESEFRIHSALVKSDGAEVRIAKGEGLQSKSQRCAVESRLVREAKNNSIDVLNGGSLADRIAFHAAEIIRLTGKLAN